MISSGVLILNHYRTGTLFGFYVEEAMWVTVDNSLDDEFVAFARCVRSSQHGIISKLQ